MGKTFEALERAKQESGGDKSDFFGKSPEKETTSSAKPESHLIAKKSYYELKNNLSLRYPDQRIRSILFVGASNEDGASSVAVNYATFLSEHFGKRVLLIDLDGVNVSLDEDPELDHTSIFTDNDFGEMNRLPETRKVGQGNLIRLFSGRKMGNRGEFFESDRIDQFLKLAHEKFDFLIMAATSISGFPEAHAFCAEVDGVIMVILSGKTRRQIAVKAKESIEQAGGTLLGLILNKRKYYIPESIYRRL